MDEQNETNDAPALPNGAAHDMVPVMGIDPVATAAADAVVTKPKRKRRRKAAPAKPRAPRARRVDPLLAEQANSAAITPEIDRQGSPAEPSPSPIVRDGEVTARRERAYRKVYSDNAPRPERHPPLKSSWRQRFVAGLRNMVGFDTARPDVVDLTTAQIIADGDPKVWADLSRKDVRLLVALLVTAVIVGATLPAWYGW